MADQRTRIAGWGVVVLGVLLMGTAWAAMAGLFFMPQGGLVLVGGGLVAFLGLQAVIFRWLGLRSAADASADASDEAGGDTPAALRTGAPAADDDDSDGDRDWRAWRG